jgi:hypothetical protein
MENLQLLTNENYVNRINNKENLPIERQSETITQSLDKLFPEQEREDKDIKEVREILCLLSKEFDNQQIKDLIAEVQFLTESWLDDFERSIFKGLTLQELFHEKGGL